MVRESVGTSEGVTEPGQVGRRSSEGRKEGISRRTGSESSSSHKRSTLPRRRRTPTPQGRLLGSMQNSSGGLGYGKRD